ncbi:Uncharacterised protein [Mycobacteroides abscessus subsp. abscessus]|nr:Uncharacterised protein [Mycobacteroides abscessus subsp. abscessus]
MNAPPPNRWQVRRHPSGRWIASITYDPPRPVAPGVATRDRAQWTDTHAEAIAYADRKAREGGPTMTNDARLTDLTYPPRPCSKRPTKSSDCARCLLPSRPMPRLGAQPPRSTKPYNDERRLTWGQARAAARAALKAAAEARR